MKNSRKEVKLDGRMHRVTVNFRKGSIIITDVTHAGMKGKTCTRAFLDIKGPRNSGILTQTIRKLIEDTGFLEICVVYALNYAPDLRELIHSFPVVRSIRFESIKGVHVLNSDQNLYKPVTLSSQKLNASSVVRAFQNNQALITGYYCKAKDGYDEQTGFDDTEIVEYILEAQERGHFRSCFDQDSGIFSVILPKRYFNFTLQNRRGAA